MSEPPLTYAELVEEARRCTALWVAVVARVIRDAERSDDDDRYARRWLRWPDPLVLEMAGLEPATCAPALAARSPNIGGMK